MSLLLERIEIAGIRSVGWATDGGPGLVLTDLGMVNILYAPNGVGKTSLIEAITLGLTGKLRRRGTELDANAFAHSPRIDPAFLGSVTLTFTGNRKLSWTEIDPARTELPLRRLHHEAAELLWPERRNGVDVANLLRLTHLLPQGWGDRFMDQDGASRWALVERALGLDGVRTAIAAGQGTGPVKRALKEQVALANQAFETASSMQSRWRSCSERWLQSHQMGRELGARSPNDLRVEIDTLSRSLSISETGRAIGDLRVATAVRRSRIQDEFALLVRISEQLGESEEAFAADSARVELATSTFGQAKADLQSAQDMETWAKGAAAQLELQELRKKLTQAEANLAASTMLVHASKLDDHFSNLKRYAATIATNDASLQRIDEELASAKQRSFEAMDSHDNARKHFEEVEQQNNEISQILFALRPHVLLDPEECPVCSTHFPEMDLVNLLDDKLRALAGPVAQDAQLRLQESVSFLEEASKHLLALSLEKEATEAEQVSNLRAREEITSAIDVIRALHESTESDPIGQDGGASLPAKLRLQAAAIASVAVRPDEATLDLLRSARKSAIGAVVAAEEAYRLGEAIQPPPMEPVSPDVAAMRREQADAAVRQAAGNLGSAQQRLETVRRQMSAIKEEWARKAPSEIETLRAEEVPAKLEQWRSVQSADITLIESQIDEIEKSARAYAAMQSLRNADSDVRAEALSHNFAPPQDVTEDWLDSVDRQIQEQVAAAATLASSTKLAESTVAKWIKSLASELQSYERHCLAGIDPTMHNFLKALAPTMLWRLRLDKYRGEARSTFSNEDAPDVEPSLVFSEGEHTAVALAYLLAFHTRFPWSSWPALILDDPFQAADVVRIGALLDVLRGMTIAKGTQIFLTTHDPQLAEWAARKMTNAGIDTRHFELERGPDGIVARRKHLGSQLSNIVTVRPQE